MLLLDNWNEWGEGHYLAPYREYGFGYLDAVRSVFAPDAGPHEDLVPEDIGLGPYDTAYRSRKAEARALLKKSSLRVVKPGADEAGLVGWWAFDEATNDTVALDVWFVNRIFGGSTSSGFRLGLQDGRPCFGVPVTSFSHHLTAKDALPVGRWVHLAGTFDGQTMRLYMDGVEQGALARPGPLRPNDKPLCLGNYDAGHAAHFTGLLDEVKLYGRALDAAEVRASVGQQTR